MEQYLGKDWQQRYPATLTKQEKADIRSALLASLANGRLLFRHYLENIEIISKYPER